MGNDLISSFRTARELFEEADSVLGFSLSKLMLEASEESELGKTENAQPAILLHSWAVMETLRKEFGWDYRERVRFIAGHSVGEYTALLALGVIPTFADAIRLVVSFSLLFYALLYKCPTICIHVQ